MYSRFREQDLKHVQFIESSRLQRVRFREVSMYSKAGVYSCKFEGIKFKCFAIV